MYFMSFIVGLQLGLLAMIMSLWMELNCIMKRKIVPMAPVGLEPWISG